jgi:glutamate formiminotransferase/formiminotetrahydrofolate cyclodeaminase
MEDCVKLAHEFGKRVAAELNIPIYLYEFAAGNPQRKNLADIRKGEYEGLAEKLKDPAWKPDYGLPQFNPRAGATVTGARKFLIAYNVNLNTSDQSVASEIAARIRESGRPMKDAQGKTVKNEKGETVRIPGTLKAVKAMGVFLERFNIAQVSINLVDFETTNMHEAFEEVRKQARSLGFDATGSEIVGLVPLQAIRSSGLFYAQREGKSHISEKEAVESAIKGLGLNQLEPFDPGKKIIEYQLS